MLTRTSSSPRLEGLACASVCWWPQTMSAFDGGERRKHRDKRERRGGPVVRPQEALSRPAADVGRGIEGKCGPNRSYPNRAPMGVRQGGNLRLEQQRTNVRPFGFSLRTSQVPTLPVAEKQTPSTRQRTRQPLLRLWRAPTGGGLELMVSSPAPHSETAEK